MRAPFFSRSGRRLLLTIEWAGLLAIVLAGGYYVQKHSSGGDWPPGTADSLRHLSAPRAPKSQYVYAEREEQAETFPFDPNTADSTTLLRLGLPPFMVRNIYRYRAQHGRFHTPEDFKRVYGMTYEMWERLGPQIRIDRKYQYISREDIKRPEAPRTATAKASSTDSPVHAGTDSAAIPKDSTAGQRHTPAAPHTEKYPEGTLVDLNTADTTELKRIPGIASFRAGKIVAYRERLGGYVDVEQAMEACELPDEVLAWFCVTSTVTRKINVNTASVQQMMRHPYITFYMAKAIHEYRRKGKKIASLDELVSGTVLAPEEAEKIAPYVEF